MSKYIEEIMKKLQDEGFTVEAIGTRAQILRDGKPVGRMFILGSGVDLVSYSKEREGILTALRELSESSGSELRINVYPRNLSYTS